MCVDDIKQLHALIAQQKSLTAILSLLSSLDDQDKDDFIQQGWPGWSLDGSPAPSERGVLDGTGELAWTEQQFVAIDMYSDKADFELHEYCDLLG